MLKTSLYVRRSVVVLVIIAAASAPAWAASDKIVGSYPSPTKYPYGLAYGAGTLYLGDSVSMMVYRLDPDNGSVMGSFIPSPKPSGTFMYGLAYSSGYLWATTRSPARIFKITPADGSVVGSFGIAAASASTSTHTTPTGLRNTGHVSCEFPRGDGLSRLAPSGPG